MTPPPLPTAQIPPGDVQFQAPYRSDCSVRTFVPGNPSPHTTQSPGVTQQKENENWFLSERSRDLNYDDVARVPSPASSHRRPPCAVTQCTLPHPLTYLPTPNVSFRAQLVSLLPTNSPSNTSLRRSLEFRHKICLSCIKSLWWAQRSVKKKPKYLINVYFLSFLQTQCMWL